MRYAIRERIFSIGDDFWVTDEQGTKGFLVDGKALRLRETLELKDGSGNVLATVRKKLIAMRDTMEIERNGAVVATVRKAIISPLHHRSVVDLSDGGELEAVGNILDKEFEIRSGGAKSGTAKSGPARSGTAKPGPARSAGSRAGGSRARAASASADADEKAAPKTTAAAARRTAKADAEPAAQRRPRRRAS